MNYIKLVEVFYAGNDLMEELAGFGFLHSLVGDDVLEELASTGVLHDQIQLLRSFNYLIEETYTQIDLTSYSWMMLGCRMSLRIWISLATRSTSLTSWILSFSRIFTATYISYSY